MKTWHLLVFVVYGLLSLWAYPFDPFKGDVVIFYIWSSLTVSLLLCVVVDSIDIICNNRDHWLNKKWWGKKD